MWSSFTACDYLCTLSWRLSSHHHRLKPTVLLINGASVTEWRLSQPGWLYSDGDGPTRASEQQRRLSCVVNRCQSPAAGKQRPRPNESFDLCVNSQWQRRPRRRLVFLKLSPRPTWKDALRSPVISPEVAVLIWVEVTITESGESSVSSPVTPTLTRHPVKDSFCSALSLDNDWHIRFSANEFWIKVELCKFVILT